MLAFVQAQAPPLRLRRGYLLYFLGFVPGLGLLSLVEGSIRGMWGWSTAEWQYQFDAYITFGIVGLGLGGLLAVPLHLLIVREIRARALNVSPSALGAGSALVCLTLLAFGWLWGATFPFSFVTAAIVFGILSSRQQPSERALPA